MRTQLNCLQWQIEYLKDGGISNNYKWKDNLLCLQGLSANFRIAVAPKLEEIQRDCL